MHLNITDLPQTDILFVHNFGTYCRISKFKQYGLSFAFTRQTADANMYSKYLRFSLVYLPFKRLQKHKYNQTENNEHGLTWRSAYDRRLEIASRNLCSLFER